jgi:hypothetical protein
MKVVGCRLSASADPSLSLDHRPGIGEPQLMEKIRAETLAYQALIDVHQAQPAKP